MKYFRLCGFMGLCMIFSCSNKQNDFDASGNFEVDEVIVSAQQNGQLLSFNLEEGDSLTKAAMVGQIDVTVPTLQMEQAEATISSLRLKISSSDEQNDLVKRQLAVQEVELDHQLKEK